MQTAILLIQCPDAKGIIARVTNWVFEFGGNIIRSDQYSTDPAQGQFYMRVEFCWDESKLTQAAIEAQFQPLANELKASWSLHDKKSKMKMAVLVSKLDHCLYELLYHWQQGDCAADIVCVISNHTECEALVKSYNIPFYHVPITLETKQEQEKKLLDTVKESDIVVLARYMQILSPDFISAYEKDIINIHHSFLPSFAGAHPYQQAYDRGVKLIGATAHYVTENLDEGPIIEQLVTRVTHRDNPDTLQRKGRNLEKQAMMHAIEAHLDHRVIRLDNKTIVFD